MNVESDRFVVYYPPQFLFPIGWERMRYVCHFTHCTYGRQSLIIKDPIKSINDKSHIAFQKNGKLESTITSCKVKYFLFDYITLLLLKVTNAQGG